MNSTIASLRLQLKDNQITPADDYLAQKAKRELEKRISKIAAKKDGISNALSSLGKASALKDARRGTLAASEGSAREEEKPVNKDLEAD